MRPLAGLKVLDFCWVAVGPMTTSYLAEYGATVVRIESKRRPETLRNSPPFGSPGQSVNRSGYFANYNANKYGIGVNMVHPQARRFRQALGGLGRPRHRELYARNHGGLGSRVRRPLPNQPRYHPLQYLDARPRGPYSQQPGFGAVLASLSGMTGITGWPDRMPTNPYGAYTDFLVPRFTVPTILAALDYRRRTGRGQHLDFSQLEVSLHFMAPLLLDYTLNGRERGRTGQPPPRSRPARRLPLPR